METQVQTQKRKAEESNKNTKKRDVAMEVMQLLIYKKKQILK